MVIIHTKGNIALSLPFILRSCGICCLFLNEYVPSIKSYQTHILKSVASTYFSLKVWHCCNQMAQRNNYIFLKNNMAIIQPQPSNLKKTDLHRSSGLDHLLASVNQDTSLLVPHCLLSSYRLPSSRSPSYATSAGSWSSLVWNTANDRYNFMIFKLGVSRYPNLERSSHNPDGKSLLDFFVTKIILRYFWLVCGLEIQLWWKIAETRRVCLKVAHHLSKRSHIQITWMATWKSMKFEIFSSSLPAFLGFFPPICLESLKHLGWSGSCFTWLHRTPRTKTLHQILILGGRYLMTLLASLVSHVWGKGWSQQLQDFRCGFDRSYVCKCFISLSIAGWILKGFGISRKYTNIDPILAYQNPPPRIAVRSTICTT